MNYINYKELFACIVSTFPNFFLGLNSGYSTEYIKELSSEREVSDSEVSLIGGSGLLLAFVGCLASGYLMDTFGRKSLFFIVYPLSFVGWMMIALTEYFVLGRLLTSLANGFGYCRSIYTAEIMDPGHRGAFLSIGATFEIAGNLWIYFMEYFISAKVTAFVLAIFAFALFLCTFFIPETPYWYMMKKQTLNAVKALVWLRDGNELTIESELAHIKKNLDESSNELTFTDVVFSRQWWRTSLFFSAYLLIVVFTGFDMIIPYSLQFFAEFNRTGVQDAILSTVFMVAAFVGTLLTTLIFEKFKRTTLAEAASIINVVALAVAATSETFFRAVGGSSVVTVMCFIVYATTISIISFNLPWTIISESVPTESRSTVTAALSTEYTILSFVVVQMFPIILNAIPINYIVWSFSFVSFVLFLFTRYYLEDTRGKILPGYQNL